MGQRVYLPWNDDTVYWSAGEIDYVWSEVYIIVEVADVLGGYLPEDHTWDWLEKKIEKGKLEEFKRIVIKVNGEEKEKGDFKIGISEIRKTFEHYGFPTRKEKIGVKVEITRKRFE